MVLEGGQIQIDGVALEVGDMAFVPRMNGYSLDVKAKEACLLYLKI